MRDSKISILGCGWLGIPMAKELISEGHLIKGSTTSPEKLTILEQVGIEAFLISIGEKGIRGNIDDFLQSDLLILDIPSKLRGNQAENFVKKIELIIPFIEKSTIKNVLFVSSTSVFGDHQGVVDENALPEPDSESGRQLLVTENLLRESIHFKTTILRFGGLIGADRHPIYFLSGRKVTSPNAPVNLIHLEDCIGIVHHIISHQIWNNTIHGVSPYHPKKGLYYTRMATKYGLEQPEFQEAEKQKLSKIVDSVYLQSAPKYTFKYPDLLV